jgi:chromosome segregation ATPase
LTRLALVVIIIGAVAGCVLSAASSRPTEALVRADGLAADGQYSDALEAYGEILTKYPDTDEADRARRSRDTINGLLAARAQVARLSAEVKARDAQLKAQEAELARVRGDLAARDGELARARQEIARLTAEADRLRVDLENLKKIDIDLERRRK